MGGVDGTGVDALPIVDSGLDGNSGTSGLDALLDGNSEVTPVEVISYRKTE